MFGRVRCGLGDVYRRDHDDAVGVACDPVTWANSNTTAVDDPVHFDCHHGSLNCGSIRVLGIYRQVDLANLPNVAQASIDHKTGGVASTKARGHDVAKDATFCVAPRINHEDFPGADVFNTLAVRVGFAIGPHLGEVGARGDEPDRASWSGHANAWID